MSDQHRTPLDAYSELLASAVESYLAARYPICDLAELGTRSLQSQDSGLVRSLHNWRSEAKWPEPEVIGELRCIDCHKIMGEESSVVADETVCSDCYGPSDEEIDGDGESEADEF